MDKKITCFTASIPLAFLPAVSHPEGHVEEIAAESLQWWEFPVIICVPLLLFSYIALISADSRRGETLKKAVGNFMQGAGIYLIMVSLMTSHDEIFYMGLPVGLINILVAQWYLVFKKKYSSHDRSIRELPAAARRLGLNYLESDALDEPGTMKGQYRGFHLTVDPSSSEGRFRVRFPEKIGRCNLSFFHPRYRPVEGDIEFSSGNRIIDKKFKTRYAERDLALKIQGAGERLFPVAAFIEKWRRRAWWTLGAWDMAWLEVDRTGISYSDVPLKGGPYALPASRVEMVVPDLVAMAEALYGIAKQGKG